MPLSVWAGREKKSLRASERDEAARAAWQQMIQSYDATQLVFVDECGSHLAMTPLSARAPRGHRAVGSAPRNQGPNTTLLAALNVQGVSAALTVKGAADTAVFTVFVREILVPSLRPGQIVVLDNVRFHQGVAARECIEACGCQMLFLPPYSPDFSPIEMTFSKLKEFLRRAQARSRDALDAAFTAAIAAVTKQDVVGWFTHCGYKL